MSAQHTPGPDVCIVDAVGPRAFTVTRVSDRQRIGTYPTAEHAQRVADGINKDFRTEWLTLRTVKELTGAAIDKATGGAA